MTLAPLFSPRSVALIGMRRTAPSLGHMILGNLLASGYSGEIFLVNPNADMIENRKVHKSIAELPPVDLGVVLTAPKLAATVIDELGANGCRTVIVITAGFSAEQEGDILKIARGHGIRVLGPNSMGSFAPGANTSFSPIPIAGGSVGFISQSGSIVVVAQESLGSEGFSGFVSLGNKLDIDEVDVLEYLGQDPSTQVITAYLESFSQPMKMRNILTEISRKKPVIVVKGGRTVEGSRAVSSHTGALAGDFRLTRSLLQDCGVIVTDTIEQEMALARFITKFGVRNHSGIVTISSAGGPGVLAADEMIEAGVTLAELSQETVTRLSQIIPPSGNASNPLDLVADAGIDRYIDTITAIRDDPAVTTIVLIIVHPVLIETEELLQAVDQLELPIICAYLGPEFAEFDHFDNLVVYQTTREVAEILTQVNWYHTWKERSAGANQEHLEGESKSAEDLESLLTAYGFDFPDTLLTTSIDQARIWAGSHSAVVLKLKHPDFSHKTDSGGVILNITPATIDSAWEQLQAIYAGAGIVDGMIELQPYYSGGLELVLGAIHDQQFGHFLLLGEGGTLVEHRDDTIFLPSPTTREAVLHALSQLKFYRLLHGYRGGFSVDMDRLVDRVLALDKLITDHPHITELDINPLYLLPDQMVVLDCRSDEAS